MILGSFSRKHAFLLVGAAIFALGFAAGAAVGPRAIGDVFAQEISPSPAPSVRSATHAPTFPRGAYNAEVLSVVDGDTFEARVRVWPGLDITTKVRLRGIDTPELKARCGDERLKADAAREALRALLEEGDVAIARVGIDKYGGRILADVTTRRSGDVSSTLLARGHARPYEGGRRESWCSGY